LRSGAGAGGKVDRGWVQTFAQRSEGQDLMRVEISVESVDGVRVAARAGAARVEVHVLVRPRPGDFHYSRDEVDLVVRDIAVARRRGAAGVVVGALAGDGTVSNAVPGSSTPPWS
jgi:copper homeostasis protein CutC